MINNRFLTRPAVQLALWLVVLTLYRMWVIPRLGINLYVDEAQYWTWAKELDWGYYSKPPVIAWLIGATTSLFGNELIAVKLPALLLYPITSWVLFLLGRRLFSERTGLLAGVAFSLLPLVSALGLFVSTDAPLLLCWAGAMLLLLRALEANHWADWLLLGLVAGIGLMSKYTMGAFAISALIYLVVDAQRRRQLGNPRLWLAALLALLVLTPNLVWNWHNDFPTLRHTADITHVGGMNEKTGNSGEFIGAQILSLGPLIALAFVMGLIALRKRLSEARVQLLLSFALPLLIITFAQSLRAEANGNWAAPALIAALLIAAHWLRNHSRIAWAALALNAVLMMGVYHLNDWRVASGQPLPARWDPLNRARGWAVLAQEVRPLLTANPQAMLLVDDRAFAAQLMYELRDLKPEIVSWNWDPQGRIMDHYQLTRPLGPAHIGRDAVAVIKWPPAEIAARFAPGQALQAVRVAVAQGRELNASIGMLHDFQGLPAKP